MSLQSCPTLCNTLDCSPPGSSVHRIFQARILKWVAIPSSRRSSQPRKSNPHLLHFLHWQVGSLPWVPPGKPVTMSSCPQFAFLILSYGARPVSITRAACLRQGLAFYRRTLPPPLQVSLEQTRWQVQVNLESLQLTCTLWGVFSQTSWCLRFMILCLRHVITYYISQLNITYANIMSLEGRVASLKAQLNDLKRFNKGNNICFKLGVGDSGGK